MREGKGYSFGFWGKEKGREIFKVDGVGKGVLVSELYRGRVFGLRKERIYI